MDASADDPARELAALARAAHRLARGARLDGRSPGRRPGPAPLAAPPTGPSASAQPRPKAPAGPPPAAARTPSPAPQNAPSGGPAPPPERVEPFVSPIAEVARSAATLDELETSVSTCRACGLCMARTRTVFGDGSPTARILFVGEGPGEQEDRSGVPFVGPAGQLLTDIITKGMGLDRSRDVYITNVVKCRPPGNRPPLPEEKATCAPYLARQIELVDPELIVPLGRHAANLLLDSDRTMGRLRGQVVERDGRTIVPTYHPSYLLRTPAKKRECWQDIQTAMARLGLEPPARGGSAGSPPTGAR